MKKIKLWMKAVRAPFFTASIIPVLVGAVLSNRLGYFRVSALLFALIIVIANHAGSNLLNDYCDAEGSDRLNTNPTPFSGGSRLIQENKIKRDDYLKGALWCYAVALALSLAITIYQENMWIFLLSLGGACLGAAYSAFPFYGMGRGWGELAIGAAFGPLAVVGSFELQANFATRQAWWAGIPVGFLIMGVLILNEFPDLEADRAAGKTNWIVRVGGGTIGVWIYLTVISLAYLTVLVGVVWRIFPVKVLFSYTTIPLAVWIVLKLWRNRNGVREKLPEFIPAMAGNIGLHLLTGILLLIGLW